MSLGPIPGKPKPDDKPVPIIWRCSDCGNKNANWLHRKTCAACGNATAPIREAA